MSDWFQFTLMKRKPIAKHLEKPGGYLPDYCPLKISNRQTAMAL